MSVLTFRYLRLTCCVDVQLPEGGGNGTAAQDFIFGQSLQGYYNEILELIEDVLKFDNTTEYKQQLKKWAGSYTLVSFHSRSLLGKDRNTTGGRRWGIKLMKG
jgi:hypothetical protein